MLQGIEQRALSACAAVAGECRADSIALRPRLRQKHRGLSLNPTRSGVGGPRANLLAEVQRERGFQTQGNWCHAESCEPP
jgi:hypothetical protein